MKKTPRAKPSKVTAPTSKRGVFNSTARLAATIIGARVAAATGKKGLLGLAAGMGAKRLITRFPVGAVLVSGAYMAGKLYEAKREMDRKRPVKALPDKAGAPILIDDARKRLKR